MTQSRMNIQEAQQLAIIRVKVPKDLGHAHLGHMQWWAGPIVVVFCCGRFLHAPRGLNSIVGNSYLINHFTIEW